MSVEYHEAVVAEPFVDAGMGTRLRLPTFRYKVVRIKR